MVTPWLTAAIEERLGGGHRVEVGGTMLERDEAGKSALRLRDVVVRDAQGTIVASAPKAEVGLDRHGPAHRPHPGRPAQPDRRRDGAAHRCGRPGRYPRDQRAGARLVIIVITSSVAVASAVASPADRSLPPVEMTADPLSAVLAWIDRLDLLGLDGGSLSEIGLKDGTLIVDDQRHGKRWSFEHINLGLTRTQDGGVAFAVNSTGTGGLWSLTATVTPKGDGKRTIETVVRDVSPKDLMLAMRATDAHLDASAPLSAVLRAEIERDGTLQAMEGRILAGAGYFGSRDDPDSRVQIDEAQLICAGTRRRVSSICRSTCAPARAG